MTQSIPQPFDLSDNYQIVRVPGTYVGVTYGKGTEHRAL
jgi:hypothetical protein